MTTLQPPPTTEAKSAVLNKHIENARNEILGEALIAFTEEVLGRVATDDEIQTLGYHANFADNELAVFEHEGRRFTSYYVFNGEALAIGFLNPKAQFDLSVCRIEKGKWPVALRLFAQMKADGKEVRK